MTDRNPEENKTGTKLTVLDQFAPVPRQCKRHDGWTPERQRGFIAAPADLGSVKAAAHTVGMAQEGAYQLRRHPEAAEFRKAWEAALKLGVQRLEDVAMDRALNGVEVPVYSYGKLVGTRLKYNDRLLMFLLRARAGKRFGDGGRMNLADRATLANLKRQWQKEWERDRAIADATRTREQGEDFVTMIRARHIRWWAALSPRGRAAYIEFRRIESEDMYGDWQDAEDPEDLADEYDEVFARDGRAAIDKAIEADGLADEDVLGEDLPAEPPPHRLIALTDDSWHFADVPGDGSATPV